MSLPLIDSSKITIFPRAIGKWLGVRETLFLSQGWYWQNISPYVRRDGKTFFYCSDQQWNDEFGFSQSTCDRIREKFVGKGFLETDYLHDEFFGWECRGPLWYHINELAIQDAWKSYLQRNKDVLPKMTTCTRQNAGVPVVKMTTPSLYRVNKRINKEPSSQDEPETHDAQHQFSLSGGEVNPDFETVNWQDVVDLYNEICVGPAFQKCLKSLFPEGPGMSLLRERMANKAHRSRQFWRSYFQKVNASHFLSGRSGRKRTKDGLSWYLKKANFVKVWEGNYDN